MLISTTARKNPALIQPDLVTGIGNYGDGNVGFYNTGSFNVGQCNRGNGDVLL